MRTLNIVLSDREYKTLEKMKGRNTWHEFIQDLIKDYESLTKAQIELESTEEPVLSPIIEEQCEERMHKELALKRKERASDNLFKVNERHNKKVI